MIKKFRLLISTINTFTNKTLYFSLAWGLKTYINDRKWYHTILWWEMRRIPYNFIMGIIGLFSLILGSVTIPLVYVFIAVFLNIYYTKGWIIEIKRQKENELDYPKQSFIEIVRNSIMGIVIPCVFILGVILISLVAFSIKKYF